MSSFNDKPNQYNMRQQRRQKQIDQIFSRPQSHQNSMPSKPQAASTVVLPQIYSRQVRHKIPEVNIQNQNEVRRQICKVLSFKKDRVTCLEPSLYEQLPEEIQSISYSSPQYHQKMKAVNRIFGSCDLTLKERDILIAQGKRSQAKYVFITNFSYHPQSICCQLPVILKCIEKRGIQVEDDKHKKSFMKWQILCSSCNKILLKLRENEEQYQKPAENYNKKRKLLDFALHIASGRYKRKLLQQDSGSLSLQHVKSRFANIVPKKGVDSLQ